MKKAHPVSIQYLIDDGIGARLINVAARKRIRTAKEFTSARPTHPILTGDIYKDTVSLGVAALLRYVMQHLDADPIRVVSSGSSRLRIRIFGAVDYVIDRLEQAVWVEPSPISRREKASKQSPPWDHCLDSRLENIDLLNPLCKSTWLVYIAARPGWFSYTQKLAEQDQGQLFSSFDSMDSALNEVVDLVSARLKRCGAMAVFRHRLAAMLSMYLGSDLVDIALRARLYPGKASLTAYHLKLVWQNLVAFQTMDRENPRLLTALTAWLSHSSLNDLSDSADAIPAMKNAILASGLSQKAWRVLAEKGMKRLLPSQHDRSPWAMLILSLKAMAAARWPALAPRGFIRLMHDAAGRPDTFDKASAGVPGWFWQIVCNEASYRHGDNAAYQELFDSVPHWAWLVRKYDFHPDKNQRRRGCSWLREAVQFHENLEQVNQLMDTPDWALWVQSAQWDTSGKLMVVPLLSPKALITEAMALHNCADSYISRCKKGDELLISLRDKTTGRRVALALAVRRAQHWSLEEIAGPCNEPVQLAIRKYAKQAVAEINRKYSEHLCENSLSSANAETDFFDL